MEKKNFISLIMGTVGGILFAIGMCMCLLPQWNAFNQGVVISVIGLVILLIMLLVRRKLEGKPVIVKLSARTVGTVLLGIIGALVLGIGMCMTMIWNSMAAGIVVGIVGIVLLISLMTVPAVTMNTLSKFAATACTPRIGDPPPAGMASGRIHTANRCANSPNGGNAKAMISTNATDHGTPTLSRSRVLSHCPSTNGTKALNCPQIDSVTTRSIVDMSNAAPMAMTLGVTIATSKGPPGRAPRIRTSTTDITM